MRQRWTRLAAENVSVLLKERCVTGSARDALPREFIRLVREPERDPGNRGPLRIWDSAVLSSSLRMQHTPTSRQRFLATPCGCVEPVNRFFKLDLHGYGNTLRAGTGSARGAFTSPRPVHYRYVRCITNREAARLHSYPDCFRFHVTKWHAFRQIGNAVPPPMVRAIAARIAAASGLPPTSPVTWVALGDPRLLRFTI